MIALDRQWSTARALFYVSGNPQPQRGLWALWDDASLCWRCHLAGVGLPARSFVIFRQGRWRGVLAERGWLRNYRIKVVPGLWDGRPDVVIAPPTVGDQMDLFDEGGEWFGGGVGVCRSGVAAGTPRTPAAGVYGFVTPIVSPFQRKDQPFSAP